MADDRDPLPPEPTPPPQPEPHEWYIDENGNIKGRVFTFSSKHYQVFTDEAVTDPAVLAAARKPAAG